MMQNLIKLAENGMMPDALIRFGIRRLCRERLESASKLGVDAVEDHHQKWVEKLLLSPIALVPDKANEQHYEVPPEFFEYVLGKNLKYSSGYWPEGVISLDQSEDSMLEHTFGRLEIEDGMDMLELGCGWGSLTCYMAERLPNSKIVAVSNSKDQREYINTRCKENGFDNVEVITADMNDFSINQKFDRVVSVEMFEHMRNYDQLLKKVSGFLRKNGKLFVHIFSHRTLVYPFEDNGPGDWMAREFFSGGIMPSHRLLLHFQNDLKIDKVWRFSGVHYSKTSWAWLEKMDQNKNEIMKIFSTTYGPQNAKTWWQRWRIFFMSCAELFGMDRGTEWGVSHYLFVKRGES